MPYLRLRFDTPEKLLCADGAPLHLKLKSVGYFLDDFSFQDGEHYESPGKATITFAQTTKALDAKLTYESRWIDPDNNQTYPASLRLSLPLDDRVESFIANHDFDAQYLILTIYFEDPERAVLHMGSSENHENHWKTSTASSLQVKIQCLSVDLDPRPEAESIAVEAAKPLSLQEELLPSFQNLHLQNLQATNELYRQLRAIKVILLVMLIGALIYGFSK